MNKPEHTLAEKISFISGVISAICSVLGIVFDNELKKALSLNIPEFVWWILIAFLIVSGFLSFKHGITRRSRLLRPEALLLKSHKAEHLKGREEDIERLLKLCREHPLVHLVGESGAGKSAMLQAGLCLKLREDNVGVLPIYIEVWGQDWEAGPRSALTEAFWQSLSEMEQQTLNLKPFDNHADIFAMLKQRRSSLRRTPLLIFDQFDDYQTRHRDRFLSSHQRTWLGVEKLVAANAFWREIKTLLDDGAIHCLFVTRLDAADGLKSVRFVKEEIYRLDRLQENIVAPLLTELTTSADENAPIIYAPERGWDKLKQRLAKDLGEQSVLPAQMKIAIQGLARLKTLTIGDYQRFGRLPGLEARHIEGHITEAERHFAHTEQGAQLTQKQIRNLLLAFVNRETLKTVPRSNEELEQIVLADHVGKAKPLQQVVQDCLDYLQQREIIRKRVDPDTRNELWLLDHDYLCAGVLEAERRANRWLALLEARSHAFEEAGNHLLKKWRALLNPWQQMILVIQWLMGRLRYGALRAFAQWSLLRFVPYVLVLLFFSYGWYQWSTREQVIEIFSEIGVSEGGLSSSEIDALWALATSNDGVRFSFLEQALAIPEYTKKFDRRLENSVHALVGLNPVRREKVLKESLLRHLQNPETEKTIKETCDKIRQELVTRKATNSSSSGQIICEKTFSGLDSDSLDISVTTDDLEELLKSMENLPDDLTEEEREFKRPAYLASIPAELAPEDAIIAFKKILAQMDRLSDPSAFSSEALSLCAEVLAVVAEKKIASNDACSVFAPTLTLMEKSSDIDNVCQSLEETLKVMAEKLAPEDATKIFDQTQARMKTASRRYTFTHMVAVLAAVTERLTPENANQAFVQILAWMKKTTDLSELESLAEVLAAIIRKLSPKHANQAFAQIPAWIEKEKVIEPDELARALAVGMKELTPERANQAFAQILAQMQQPIEHRRLVSLIIVLTAVAENLTPDYTYSAFKQLLTWKEMTFGGWDYYGKWKFKHSYEYLNVLFSIEKALAVIVVKLPPDHADSAFVQMGELMGMANQYLRKNWGSEEDADAYADEAVSSSPLAVSLPVVAAKLPPEHADQAFSQILAWMEGDDHFFHINYLKEALVAVERKLAPQYTDWAFSQILARMELWYGNYLGEALVAVVRKLAPQNTGWAFTQILALIEKITDSDALKSLAEALAAMPGKLAPEHADRASAHILAQMEKDNDNHVLAQAFAAVPGNRNPQQLIDLMKWPTCVGEVRAPLLAKLEQQTGQKFEGNVWKMVEWAQANGYDVTSPPRRPSNE